MKATFEKIKKERNRDAHLKQAAAYVSPEFISAHHFVIYKLFSRF